jgi:hypothetical protein
MKQKAAKRDLSIKIVTSIVFIMMVGFFIASIYINVLIIAALITLIILIFCYLYAPTAYEISNNRLIVYRNYGKREFTNVTGCRYIEDKVPFTIRLWGNGGVFAGTGIFWNRLYGVFRMYITHARQSEFVVVQTDRQIIVISPENPRVFRESWKTQSM